MDGGKMRIERCVRSLEEVQEFIEHAKLHDDDLLPESQILYFDDKGEDYKVLELNSEVQKAFTEGLQVVLRGENNKKAVLCTDCHTFELLEAETSNSSLLVPNLNLSVSNELRGRHLEERLIAGVFYSCYELRKIKPPFLHNLRSLLNACPYRGPEHEQMTADCTAQRLYSTNDLLNICQASSEELNQALDSIGAFNIDGYWRLLHFDYHLRVFSQLLNLVSSNSWPLDGVPETETVETLGDIFPKVVIQHVFSLFTKPTYERNEDGDALYTLIEYNVCRFLGEALLHDSAGSRYNLEEFTEAWQSSVPDGMTTSLDQLRGVAVVFENNNVQQIKLCLEQDLPNNTHERIDRLFSVKSKWTLDEITPYIKPLLPEKGNVKTTVMKYAQESTVNNIKWYSRRP